LEAAEATDDASLRETSSVTAPHFDKDDNFVRGDSFPY